MSGQEAVMVTAADNGNIASEEENNATTVSATTPQTCSITKLGDLPLLPPPDLREIKRQTRGGIAIVLFIAAALISLTHGIALTLCFDREEDAVAWWTIFGLIYSQATLALVFLVGVLNVDPGIVHRSKENCFPLPPEIAAWLESYDEDLRPIEQYLQDQTPNKERDTYCTRCLIWRRQPTDVNQDVSKYIRYYHCSICQRCVR